MLAMALPVLLLLTGMLGAMFPAVNATTTERELGTLETLLVTPAGRTELLVAKAALVLLCGLLTAGLNMLSMALVLWRSVSMMQAAIGPLKISISSMILTYVAAVPTLITFSTIVLIVGLLARNFREANSLATPVMMIPLASMLVGIAEPDVSAGLLVTPVANTTIIIREVMTGRVSALAFVLAFASSCLYAGLLLSVAARVFTSEQLVNPAWEPVSLTGLKFGAGRRRRRRLPAIDEAFALFAVVMLLSFYITPSLVHWPLIPMLTAVELLLIAAPAVLFATIGHYDWIATFQWRRAPWPALVGGALVGLGLVPWADFLYAMQVHVWKPDPNTARVMGQIFLPALAAHPWLTPIVVGVLAGVCEEILFRGPIQTGLLRRMPVRAALIAGGCCSPWPTSIRLGRRCAR
jgi:sodium transport system permease protein